MKRRLGAIPLPRSALIMGACGPVRPVAGGQALCRQTEGGRRLFCSRGPGLRQRARRMMHGARSQLMGTLQVTLLGVGAMNSPRYAPAGLLVEYATVRVAIDGSPCCAGRCPRDEHAGCWRG